MTITQEQCARAFYWSSFSPEKRGESLYQYYTEKMAILPDDKKSKFTALFSAYLSAQSKCASSAVTGPAKFPVERNRKRMEWAIKHWQRLEWFLADKPKAHKQTLTEAQEKLSKLQSEHENKHYWARTLSKAKIERLESNIQAVESFEDQSFSWGDVKNCKEDQRIRFFFNDRPSAEIIAMLKKNGMKWSPSNKAWQRQTTPNAIRSINNIIAQLNQVA